MYLLTDNTYPDLNIYLRPEYILSQDSESIIWLPHKQNATVCIYKIHGQQYCERGI